MVSNLVSLKQLQLEGELDLCCVSHTFDLVPNIIYVLLSGSNDILLSVLFVMPTISHLSSLGTFFWVSICKTASENINCLAPTRYPPIGTWLTNPRWVDTFWAPIIKCWFHSSRKLKYSIHFLLSASLFYIPSYVLIADFCKWVPAGVVLLWHRLTNICTASHSQLYIKDRIFFLYLF